MSQSSSLQDQAKRLLMDCYLVSPEQAEDFLRCWARACNRPLGAVAAGASR
jgi:hypothetical protein